MEERDPTPTDTPAGGVVDQFDTRIAASVQSAADVLDPQRDMVEPLTTPIQKPGDGRTIVERSEQFEPCAPRWYHCDFHPLLGDGLGRENFETQNPEKRRCRGETPHRYADVVEHGADLTCEIAGIHTMNIQQMNLGCNNLDPTKPQFTAVAAGLRIEKSAGSEKRCRF